MRRRLSQRGARVIPLDIPATSPLFEGHFPGRPILPGVGLLDLVLRALPAGRGGAGLSSVDHWKLRHVVVPGERLALDATSPGPAGAVRLEVHREAELVARGALTIGTPASDRRTSAGGGPAATSVTGRAAAPATPPGSAGAGPDLDRLLPHRGAIRFVAGVEAEAENGLVCTARVPAGSPFAADGTAPALVTIEMAAQAAAVFEALRRHAAVADRATESRGTGPRIGYLVGARGVRFLAARIPAGAACRVSIRLAGAVGPLSTYEFAVAREGDPVAEGTVSTWITATDA